MVKEPESFGHPKAIKDLKVLRAYIQKDSEQDAAAVVEPIVTGFELLRVQPHIGRPSRVIAARELVLTGTPCFVPSSPSPPG